MAQKARKALGVTAFFNSEYRWKKQEKERKAKAATYLVSQKLAETKAYEELLKPTKKINPLFINSSSNGLRRRNSSLSEDFPGFTESYKQPQHSEIVESYF